MSLPIPQLDDRGFQDLVDQCRRLIPQYCPSWTDHNLSDPGITLIELFATIVDSMIYRLNRVPEKNYITFMNLMGIQLEPPRPASAPLTFRLGSELFGSKAKAKGIPADTEVAVQQTETEPRQPVSYCTFEDFEVRPPKPQVVLTTGDDGKLENRSRMLLKGDDESADAQARDLVPIFRKSPQVDDSCYIGFSEDLSGHLLRLTFLLETEGAGVIPDRAPLRWEAWAWSGSTLGWQPTEIEGRDETGGLNKPGTSSLELHLPDKMMRDDQVDRAGQSYICFWLRCTYIKPPPGIPGYDKSPQIRTLRIASWGGTTMARHAIPISDELLGRSNGEAGQRFQLAYTPVLKGLRGMVIEVQAQDQGQPNSDWVAWEERAHFADSGKDDLHFTVDRVSGEIRFGPSVREPDGQECQYGAIPAKNSLIRVVSYRWGGGAQGNRPQVGTLTIMTKTLPYVDSVTNRQQASGGIDAETLERAMLRAPQRLRTRERAVTTEDFEYLARAADAGIARAACLGPGTEWNGKPIPAGTVSLLLVPDRAPADTFIPARDLRLTDEARDLVTKYLYDRRMLTTELQIAEPLYVRVMVEARVKKLREFARSTVEAALLAQLYRFLNPLVGGPDEQGWPFGRELFVSEIYAVLMRVPGVAYVQSVAISAWPAVTPSAESTAALKPTPVGPDKPVAVPLGGLIRSERHQVVVAED